MSKTAAVAAIVPKKVVARVAAINLDEPTAAVLRDCFKQFGIQTVAVGDDAAQRLHKEKFEACVLRLSDPEAATILHAARTSPSNSRLVIYGVATNVQEALRFSKYGVNAVLDHPVERQSALKVVRATHLLVVHELRRYVRLPVVTEVDVATSDAKFRATCQEISAGGMSMSSTARLKKEQPVEVTFALPNMTRKICVKATVGWLREGEKLIGVRFDSSDEERLHVKRWIDDYLEIS